MISNPHANPKTQGILLFPPSGGENPHLKGSVTLPMASLDEGSECRAAVPGPGGAGVALIVSSFSSLLWAVGV